jgi:hypothetical protein
MTKRRWITDTLRGLGRDCMKNRGCAIVVSLLISLVACSKPDSSAAVSATGSAANPTAATGLPALPKAGTVPGTVGGTPPPPACPLATAADMKATLGQTFTPSATQPPQSFPSVSVCNYDPSGLLTLIVRTETLDRAGYDQSVKMVPGGGENISGLGDAAFFWKTEMGSIFIGNLMVLKGKTMLSINYGGSKADKAKTAGAEKAFAAKLVAKL